jgi:hypothetical protein
MDRMTGDMTVTAPKKRAVIATRVVIGSEHAFNSMMDPSGAIGKTSTAMIRSLLGSTARLEIQPAPVLDGVDALPFLPAYIAVVFVCHGALMPRLPRLPTSEEAYSKNTKEQYEELGRFVEMFELMVNEARESCIDLLSKDGDHRELVQIAFHHQSLTAKPLFEIMRAIITEMIKDQTHFHYNERTSLGAILGQVQSDTTASPICGTISFTAHGLCWVHNRNRPRCRDILSTEIYDKRPGFY